MGAGVYKCCMPTRVMEEEVAFVKKDFMVTLPSEVAAALRLKDNERARVLFDKEKKRVVYQF